MIQYAVFEKEEDWLDFRAKYFTASEASRLITEPKKKGELLSIGAKTYVREIVANILATPETTFYNSDMERGKEMEPFAVAKLADYWNKDENDDDFVYTSQNGYVFFYDDDYDLGGTPDVIWLRKRSAEIKCPKSSTHVKYLELETWEDIKAECPEYYGQMQTNMYLTQTDECIFMSFDDRFYNEKLHAHFITVPRDEEYIERLLVKAKHAKEYKNRILELFDKPQLVNN